MKKIVFLLVTLLVLSVSAPVFAMATSENVDLAKGNLKDEELFNQAIELYDSRVSKNEDTKIEKAVLTNCYGEDFVVNMYPIYDEDVKVKINSIDNVPQSQSFAISLDSRNIEYVGKNIDKEKIDSGIISTKSTSMERPVLGWDDAEHGNGGYDVKMIVTLYYDQTGNNGYKITGVKNSWTSYQSGTYVYELSSEYWNNGPISATDDQHAIRDQHGFAGTIFNNHTFDLTNQIDRYAYHVTDVYCQIGVVTTASVAHNQSYWKMWVPNWLFNSNYVN